jgi:hypothetical protein
MLKVKLQNDKELILDVSTQIRNVLFLPK